VKLKNYMEIIVFNNLDKVLDECEDVCKCERCRFDIAAVALNSLPPKYYLTEKGGVYSKVNELDQQFRTDVITAISKAIQKVKAKPNH